MNLKIIIKKINNFFRNIRYTLYIKYLLTNRKILFDKKKISFKENKLTLLMNKYYSDKGNLNNVHNYAGFYHALFENIVSKKLNFFEVGLGSIDSNISFHMKYVNKNYQPLASLKAWQEYFYNSEIYGADIDKKIIKNLDRIKTFYVDMTSKDSIINMWNNIGKNMDIIIDDGFHSYDANINFFNYSYNKLNNDGYYIIEDIHRKPSNIKKFYNYFSKLNIKFQIIDLPHKNNVNDNCLIFIKNEIVK